MSHTPTLSTAQLSTTALAARLGVAAPAGRPALAARGWTLARVLFLPGAAAEELQAIASAERA